jgi:hypothetical protein
VYPHVRRIVRIGHSTSRASPTVGSTSILRFLHQKSFCGILYREPKYCAVDTFVESIAFETARSFVTAGSAGPYIRKPIILLRNPLCVHQPPNLRGTVTKLHVSRLSPGKSLALSN